MSIPFFPKYPNKTWGLLHTLSRKEKIVKRYLVGAGFPCYLPLLKYKAPNGEKRETPMFRGYLFAAWGAFDATQINYRSYIHKYCFHHVSHEDFILESMEMIHKIELAAAQFPVSPCENTKEGKKFTVKSGVLAGCTGYVKDKDGLSRFVVGLDLLDTAFEIVMPKELLAL